LEGSTNTVIRASESTTCADAAPVSAQAQASPSPETARLSCTRTRLRARSHHRRPPHGSRGRVAVPPPRGSRRRAASSDPPGSPAARGARSRSLPRTSRAGTSPGPNAPGSRRREARWRASCRWMIPNASSWPSKVRAEPRRVALLVVVRVLGETDEVRGLQAHQHAPAQGHQQAAPRAHVERLQLVAHDVVPRLLQDAPGPQREVRRHGPVRREVHRQRPAIEHPPTVPLDRKSTRLNSSHVKISYAVFCLKKKKKK